MSKDALQASIISDLDKALEQVKEKSPFIIDWATCSQMCDVIISDIKGGYPNIVLDFRMGLIYVTYE